MSRERGFTLIEVMIAGAIIVVAMLSAIAMTMTAYDQLGRSQEESIATTLGQQRLEWLRNQDYLSSSLTTGTTTETLTGIHYGYVRTTKIVDDTPQAGIKQITIVTTGPSGTAAEISALFTER